MPSFGKLFIASKGKPITYNETMLTLADKFPVSNGETIIVSIEKVSSDCRQGLSIDITGYCEINGKVFKHNKRVTMLFWADTIDNPTKVKIYTKNDCIWVKNIWESIGNQGKAYVDSGHNGAAMIVEEIENGRRYRCNDGYPDEDFDDIVFTIKKMNSL